MSEEKTAPCRWNFGPNSVTGMYYCKNPAFACITQTTLCHPTRNCFNYSNEQTILELEQKITVYRQRIKQLKEE